MKFLTKRAARLKRGSVSTFFAFAMIPMVGIMALGFEIGNVAVHQHRLQNYVDNKAIAALKEAYGAPPQLVEFHGFQDGIDCGAAGCEDADAAPVMGRWDFTPFGSAEPFTQTTNRILPAGQVPAFQVQVNPFEVPLLFGPLFNVPSVQIHAEAVAFAPRREVVIVQDVSGSMCAPQTVSQCDGLNGNPPALPTSRIEQAKLASQTLIANMDAQQFPGDRVGFVAFNSAVVASQNPVDMTNVGQINNLSNNVIGTLLANLGTNIPAGLAAAIPMFGATGPDPEVERIIIVVGDGDGGGSSNVERQQAINLGIEIHTIFIGPGGAVPPSYQTLTTPTGQASGVDSDGNVANQLTSVMVDIVTGVSMRLVQ